MSVVAPAGKYESSPASVHDGGERQIQITADGKQVISGAVTATPSAVGSGTAAAAGRVVLATDVGLPAGESYLGTSGTPGDLISVNLSLNAAVAYADGDVLADTQTLANAVRVVGGRAILQSIVVQDEDDQKQAFDLYFLDAANGLGTENDPPNITDANARSIIGKVSVAVADYYDLGGVAIANINNIGLMLEATAATRDLYIAAISRGTGTYTASGIRLRIGLRWD